MEPRDSCTDDELMVRVRSGSRSAFAELYARHSSRVHAYLWRMLQDQTLAEDLRQEAFIRLWQARVDWSPHGSVPGYLIRVAKNLALNAAEKRRVRRQWSRHQAGRPQPVAPPADAVVEQRNLASRINAAIESLPERPREIFIMKRDAGLSYREIGELLGISPKTVEAHMGKAYALLRNALSGVRDQRS